MDPYFKKLFLDRIYRINKNISQFPDETVKTKSACGGILKARIRVQRHFDLVLFREYIFSAKRIKHCRFLQETGIKKSC